MMCRQENEDCFAAAIQLALQFQSKAHGLERLSTLCMAILRRYSRLDGANSAVVSFAQQQYCTVESIDDDHHN